MPFPTVEACVADVNQDIEDLKATAAADGLTYTQSCADRTLAGLHDQLGCETDFAAVSTTSCEVCQPVHGDKAIGAACSEVGEFSDCASNLICSNAKCIDPCARLAAGATCVSTDGGAFEVLGTCADGLYCDFTVTKTCKARVSSGGDCFGFDDCNEGLVCGADGKCGAPPADGEACTGVCAGDLICDNSVCAKGPGEGETCSMNGQCAGGLECGDSNVCVALQPLICEILVDN